MSSHLTTKPSIRTGHQSLRVQSPLLATAEPVVAEVAVEAEVGVAAVEVVEDAAKIVDSLVEVDSPETVAVEAVVKIKVSQARVRIKVKALGDTPGTRHPGTRTCLHSSPASGTGPMGNRHIFVWNPDPVHGRIFGSLSQTINEIQISSDASKMLKI